MDESQVDAIIRAIREPGRVAREHVQRRRVAAARSLAKRRVVAGRAPPGIAPRAVLAQAAGHRLIGDVLKRGSTFKRDGCALGWQEHRHEWPTLRERRRG